MKHLFICCLHLEAKCFTKKRGLKLSAADLVAQPSEHVEQPAAVIPEQIDQIVKGSNVSLQDDTEMVAVIPNADNKIDFIYTHYDFDDIDIGKQI